MLKQTRIYGERQGKEAFSGLEFKEIHNEFVKLAQQDCLTTEIIRNSLARRLNGSTKHNPNMSSNEWV